MKRTVALTVLLVALTAAWAQGPNGSGTYYKGADGLKGKALKTKLAGIIVNPRNVGYDGLYEGYKKTDTRPDGYVRDWYSNTTKYRHVTDKAGSYKKEGDCYNREHSVPQSWFSGAGIKSDIVHVLPTDGYVNNRRSNYPFGEVKNATYTSNNGYSKLGSCKTSGYSGTVFEPNDEIKGDIARIYFYMITRYEGSCSSWGHDVFTSTYPGLTTWTLNMMMRWSKEDPVDAREIARNNAVYEVQGNRNPYVDYPGLEEYTWGDKMTESFSYDNYDASGTSVTVLKPTFLPDGGTYQQSVEVTMSCVTAGASIYYTTDGSTPTTSSTRYSGAITLTETTTLKAIAVKDEEISSITTAEFTIVDKLPDDPTPGDEPVEGTEMQICSAFFGSDATGTIGKTNSTDLVGEQDGVTVVYALGSGNQRYSNKEQIRLYPGNTLSVSVNSGKLTEIEIYTPESEGQASAMTLRASSTNELVADVGSVNGLTWSGDYQTVTFSVTGPSGHIKITGLAAKISYPTGISPVTRHPSSLTDAWYTLDGRKLSSKPARKGIYIHNGVRVVIK